MNKLLRIALLLPLGAGAAWAQASGARGSAAPPGDPGSLTPSVTSDTRTPLQQKAQRYDEATPALPGDATKPENIPNTAPESDRAGMPQMPMAPKRRTDVDRSDRSKLGDHDQLDSDK
jgi:hypothetical protein